MTLVSLIEQRNSKKQNDSINRDKKFFEFFELKFDKVSINFWMVEPDLLYLLYWPLKLLTLSYPGQYRRSTYSVALTTICTFVSSKCIRYSASFDYHSFKRSIRYKKDLRWLPTLYVIYMYFDRKKIFNVLFFYA